MHFLLLTVSVFFIYLYIHFFNRVWCWWCRGNQTARFLFYHRLERECLTVKDVFTVYMYRENLHSNHHNLFSLRVKKNPLTTWWDWKSLFLSETLQKRGEASVQAGSGTSRRHLLLWLWVHLPHTKRLENKMSELKFSSLTLKSN